MTYPQPYAYPVVPVQTQVLVQPYRCSTAHVVVAWLLAVGTGGYLLPWAVAATRNRRNVGAVALVDLFLGWTVIGWVVALVMACGSDRPVVLVQHTYAPVSPWGPPPVGSAPPPVPPVGWSPPPVAPAPTAPPVRTAPPALAPAPRSWAPEPTMVDPFSSEPTVWLDDRPGHSDRR